MAWAVRTRRGALLFVFIALVGTVVFLRTRTAWDAACNVARAELPRLLHADVQIGSCELNPLTQSVVLKQFEIWATGARKRGELPVFSAERAEMELASFSPIFRKLTVAEVTLTKPKLRLDFSKKTSEDGCFLTPAQSIELERLHAEDGEVELNFGRGRTAQLSKMDLTWKLRRGVGSFELTSTDGTVTVGNGKELPLTRLLVQGGLSLSDEELDFSRAELTLGESSINLNGRIEELCAPQLSLEVQAFLPLRELSKVVPLPSPASGHLWSRFSLSGEAKSPLATVEMAGSELRVGNFRPGDFRAQLSYAAGNLSVNALNLQAGPGTVRASGQVQLIPGLPAHIKAEFTNASFGDILKQGGLPGSWVNFAATGHGQAAGRLWPLDLSGDAELRGDRFLLASKAYDAPESQGKHLLEFPKGDVSTRIHVLGDRAELSGTRISAGRTTVMGNAILYYASAKGLDIDVSSDSVDLSDFHHLASFRWAGKGNVKAQIRGPYAGVVIDASLSLRDALFWDYALGVVQSRLRFEGETLSFPAINAQKGHTPYSGRLSLVFGRPSEKGSADGLKIDAEMRVPSGRTEDLVDLLSPLGDSVDVLKGVLTGEVSADFRLKGPADRFSGEANLDLHNTLYYRRSLGDGQIKLTFFDGKGLRLLPSGLKSKTGTLTAEGTLLFAGPLDYRFRLDGFSLAEIVGQPWASKGAVGGTVLVEGTVGGTAEQPEVLARASSSRVVVGDRNVGTLLLEAKISGKDFELQGRPMDGAFFHSALKLEPPYAYDAELKLDQLDLRTVLSVARTQGFSGTLKGNFRARGALQDPSTLEASADVSRISLSRADFRAENDGPLALSWSHGRLSVDAFAFKGMNTEFSVSGWAGPKDVDLQMRGALDVRLLESFVPHIERSSGRVEVTANAKGTVDDPALVGEARISDGRLSIRDQPLSFKGLNGRVNFSEARILMEDFQGVLNNGRVALRSDIRLERFWPKNIEVGLQLDEVSLRPLETLPVTVTGELLLYGQPQALTLSGDLDLRKFRYDQPLQVEALLTNFKIGKPVLGSSGVGQEPKAWLALDVGIHANGDVRVDNNLVSAKLGGDLKLTGNNVRPGLLGSIELAEGSQATFRGNQFLIRQGTVEFRDRQTIDPVFELRAATQIREYLISLHAFGRADKPQLLLSSEPELSEADILSLLALGVISRDRDSDAATTGAGLAAEALFNASGLGQQVQRFLPKNRVFRDLSFHLATGYNSASGLVEPTAQLESKFLTDQLKLSMTQPVSGQGTRGTRAQAEYRFDDRISAQAQWDNATTGTGASFGNLGLELKLRWEVE